MAATEPAGSLPLAPLMLGSRLCSCCYWRKRQPSEARERLASQRPWLDAPPRRHHIPFGRAPPSSPPVPGRLAQAKRTAAGPGSMADPPAGSPPVTRQISSASPGQHMEEEPVELRDAAKCLVVDAAGKAIPFGSLYREQKAIVTFVRVRDAALPRPAEGRLVPIAFARLGLFGGAGV